MPDNRRAPLLAYVLAVAVFVADYAGTFGTRNWAEILERVTQANEDIALRLSRNGRSVTERR